MNNKEIQLLGEKFRDARVVVFGDFGLKTNWDLEQTVIADTIKPEQSGKYLVKQLNRLSGAASVAAYLASFSPADVYAVGTVSNDLFGREILHQLKNLNINTQFMTLQSQDIQTDINIQKNNDGHEKLLINVTAGNRDHHALDRLQQALDLADVCIYHQHGPNSLNDALIDSLNRLFTASGKPVIVDSPQYADRFVGVYHIINETRAMRMCDDDVEFRQYVSTEVCEKCAKLLYDETGHAILMPRSLGGLLVADQTGVHHISGFDLEKAPADSLNAGYLLTSAYALSLAVGETPDTAAEFANLATGAALASPSEQSIDLQQIMDFADRAVYISNPELARDVDRAHYFSDTEIEICVPRDSLGLGRIKAVIFDNDGSLCTLRENANEILEQMMIQCILGQDHHRLPETTVPGEIRQYIKTNNHLDPLSHMSNLAAMVNHFGYVKDSQILDSMDYLKIYNKAVMEPVRRHLSKIEKGELEPSDFIIKGAEPLMEGLRDRDIKLFLISNAELVDLEREAELLEYNMLFNGGIYGALGNGATVSKAVLINKLVVEHNLHAPEFTVFTNGAMEIRACRKYDGLAIGMASDQVRRYGLDLLQRERLIRAGAQLILPDYSQWELLLDLLTGE